MISTAFKTNVAVILLEDGVVLLDNSVVHVLDLMRVSQFHFYLIIMASREKIVSYAAGIELGFLHFRTNGVMDRNIKWSFPLGKRCKKARTSR